MSGNVENARRNERTANSVTSPGRDPIAIVGIGCRFPGGASDPERFWQLLRDGRDAISEVPPDRWSIKTFYDPEPGTPGKTNARWGGFVGRIDEFDAGFFGISPREAARMDPQQRMLLEVAVEALHDGGQALERVAGIKGSVYIGISSYDYTVIQQGPGDRLKIDAHSNTGGALSIAANRISYFLNLRGASLALDTACSSSLVAVHLACQDLWRGESALALAGGVNVLIKPEPFVGFSRLSMLSPDGRCKAFDAGANGFVRSEGAGIVVLKRLADAIADGDQVYSLIVGSGSNQDGRTSSMTVPSQEGQEILLRDTCRQAGIEPRDVDFVEAHGTGTLVGDPIEAMALGNVFGEGRAEGDYCTIGSVKTNIGHLEPASGIAGLIKTALALRHGEIPANLHFTEPNSAIPFEALKIRVASERVPLPAGNGPVVAGVNSFGFGGTNAHVLMQQAPPDGSPDTYDQALADEPQRSMLIPLTARSPEALRSLADEYRHCLAEGGPGSAARLADVAWTASMRRSHFEHRLAIVADTKEDLQDALGAFAAGETRPGMASGRCSPSDAPRTVFVCSGQGPQWWAMGRQLYETEPVFRSVVTECDEIVRSLGTWSLVEELMRDEATSRMHETAIAQPSIFALQVALASLWRSWGVEPDAVVGHSVGEVAAVHLAGVLTLEDAVRVIYHRGRCMDFAEARGKMLAVGLRRDEAEELVHGQEDRISIAAVNSPTSITLSGDGAALEPIAEELERRGVFCRFLRVNYAFHSPLMDPMRDELLAALGQVETHPAQLPIYSTVTGAPAEGDDFGAEYWWKNVRSEVRFATAADGLLRQGYGAFVELAAHPVLSASVLECDVQQKAETTVLPSLRRGDDERATMLRSLGRLYVIGASVRWERTGADGGRFVRLPAYAWHRESYWSESEESRQSRLSDDVHPILGQRMRTAQPVWQNLLDLRVLHYVEDHRVQGHVLLPGTSFLEMTLAAGRELHGDGTCIFEDVDISRALFLKAGETVSIELHIDPDDGTVTIYSRPHETDQAWNQHARGKLRVIERVDTASTDLDAIRGRCPVELPHDECYERLRSMGLEYGPAFRGVERVWCGEKEALGRIVVPDSLHATWDSYQFHPAAMDACLHPVMIAISQATGSRTVYLPVALDQLRVPERARTKLWSHVRILSHSSRAVLADIRILDDDGRVLLEMRGARCQSVDQGAGSTLDDLVYEYRWQPAPLGEGEGDPRGDMPEPSRVADLARDSARRLDDRLGLVERTQRFEAAVDPVCAALILDAYETLGGSLEPGQRFTLDELTDRLGAAPRFRRLIERHCRLLADDGFLVAEGPVWVVKRAPDGSGPRWADLLERHPAFYAELSLVGRTGRHLADVLRGERDPLEVIFPEGSLADAEHLYQDSPTLRFYNLLASETIGSIVAELPADRRLRVLEIGAGTGGMTSHLISRFPAERTSYTYSDVSNHFFLKAEEKFRGYPFLEFKRLDIEQDPAEQGFEAHSFDLIVASDALHATADLRKTLSHVNGLLASRGMLMTIEGSRPVRWVDLVFGMTDGWWKFSDRDLRPEHALLPFGRWAAVLTDLGFTECVDVLGRRDSSLQHHVLLARRAEVTASESTEEPEETAAGEPGSWLILADGHGTAEGLAEELAARGERTVIVHPGHAFRALQEGGYESGVALDDMRRIMETLSRRAESGCRGVIHCWNLDSPPSADASSEDVESSMESGCLSVVNLVRAMTEAFEEQTPRLWIVTRGAESVGDAPQATEVIQSPVWGLNRVIVNEIPRLRSTLVDLGAEPSAADASRLVGELFADVPEDEIALRDGGRFVHRYVRLRPEDRVGDTAGPDRAFRLETSSLGTIDKLAFRAIERRRPQAGEVEIEVLASALNFSDVMKALGLYPGLEDGPIPLGIECAGRVAAVGDGVEGLRPGDEVLAIAPFSFASFVTTTAHLVVPKPQSISFEEAATIPVAFLTAYYALQHLGHLDSGERVLVHSATGGVGLAAIQLVRRAGAEVFATAGTPAKRDLLRAMGIRHVMDSRSVDFADEILEATDGEGVDVVLNSLAGEAISKGLEILRDDGRFLEIGKRDIYQNSRVGLRPFRKNLSFMGIDLDREMRRRPALLARLFGELMQGFEDGSLRPLVHRVFPAGNVSGAFRYMAQAKHVGKIVLSLEDRTVAVAPQADLETSFRDDRAYLITGGLGGFGLTVARWMVERGARHLVLLGRGGAASPEAEQAVADLREAGANVVVARADVSRAEDVARVLDDIDAAGRPLGGVLHAAMVLDDCLVLNMTETQLRKVWGPKVLGAWHLHRLTRGRELDCFVLFSSISAVFGAGGQGNYTSANAFLDALAFHRRARGLPALTVSWGYLGEVGFVARHGAIADRFEAIGVRSFSPDQALSLLGRFLADGTVHAGVMRVDWRRWRQTAAAVAMSPRFAHLVMEGEDDADEGPAKSASALRAAIQAADPSERRELIEPLIREQVAKVLGASPTKLDADRPLSDLGLDSLMAVELKNWIEGELGLTLPSVELLRGPSVADLTGVLLDQLAARDAGDDGARAAAGIPSSKVRVQREDAEELLSRIDEMSDDEIDAALVDVEPGAETQVRAEETGL